MKTIRQIEIRSKKLSLSAAEEAGMYTSGVTSPQEGVAAIKKMLPDDLFYERFVCLLLESNHKPLAIYEAGRGSIHACQVDMKEVFSPAIHMKASAMIIAHNHPSGSATPSAEDIALTQRIGTIANLLGICLLDHLLITESGATSFAQLGLMPKTDSMKSLI